MKYILKSVLLLWVIFFQSHCNAQNKIEVRSPDGNIKFDFSNGSGRSDDRLPVFTVKINDRVILLPSFIKLNTQYPGNEGAYRIIKTEKSSVSGKWINNFGERKAIPDNYNQVKIFTARGGTKINFLFRSYNEGVAFAYEFPEQKGKDSVTITEESIGFSFPSDYPAWSAEMAQAKYSRVPLSKIVKGCERPLVIEFDSTLTIALAEAKLVDYARMKFEPDPTKDFSLKSRLDSEVHRALPFQSPWRVVMIGKNPGDLLEKNYTILNLNDACAIEDVSWIRPGKVLREVTLTTTGAKAAIDFTSSHNMQYMEFDAGWYGLETRAESDASAVNLDPARSKGPLDMEEIIKYAKSKNIGILLYVNRIALEKQIDDLLPIYQKWGIAGIKFGFVQVGNQKVTSWLHEAIKKAASYRMVVDVHDEYRPTGFARTYPNFLTQEGIRGDEESPSNSHTLTTMFTPYACRTG